MLIALLGIPLLLLIALLGVALLLVALLVPLLRVALTILLPTIIPLIAIVPLVLVVMMPKAKSPGDGTRSCVIGQASALSLRGVVGLRLDDARRRTWRNLCLRSCLYCTDYILLRLKWTIVQLLLQECADGFVTVYADRVVVQQLLQRHKRCNECLEARILLGHVLLLSDVCRHG